MELTQILFRTVICACAAFTSCKSWWELDKLIRRNYSYNISIFLRLSFIYDHRMLKINSPVSLAIFRNPILRMQSHIIPLLVFTKLTSSPIQLPILDQFAENMRLIPVWIIVDADMGCGCPCSLSSTCFQISLSNPFLSSAPSFVHTIADLRHLLSFKLLICALHECYPKTTKTHYSQE